MGNGGCSTLGQGEGGCLPLGLQKSVRLSPRRVIGGVITLKYTSVLALGRVYSEGRVPPPIHTAPVRLSPFRGSHTPTLYGGLQATYIHPSGCAPLTSHDVTPSHVWGPLGPQCMPQ